MKKTQPIQPVRSTFKGLLNVQQQKLPERNKSRSRSVRNRNNTTSNFTVSRATQHDQTIPDQHSNINGQNNWGTTEEYYQKTQTNEVQKKGTAMKFEENVSSNLSKNQSSISNIREKMRKQSAELQERERNRSHSRRRRSNNTSAIQSNQSRQKPGNRSREEHTSKSRQKHVSKFPNAIHKQPQQNHPQSKDSPQYQQKQLNSLKSQLKTIQATYSIFRKQLQQLQAHNAESSSILSDDELKLRAEELNNQLEQFSFSFKENINGKTKEILAKVENCIKSRNIAGGSRKDHSQGEQSERQDQNDNQIGRMFEKVERHFGISKNNSKNNTKGIFQIMTQSTNNSYSQIQRKLLLAQDRLLK